MSYCEQNLSNYQLCIVKPGIKNLQRESKKFDLSICYEYNGQGTIYINKELTVKFGKLSSLIETSKDSQIIELFQLFIALFNSTTSDGVANLLNIESILKIMNLSINEVYNFYEEIPYKMIDIEINDINKFIINDEDNKLIEPKNIQKRIDELTKKYDKCRIFLIPSENDNILRLYIESDCEKNNETIEEEIKNLLKEEKYLIN
jgi:phosphomannomutase